MSVVASPSPPVTPAMAERARLYTRRSAFPLASGTGTNAVASKHIFLHPPALTASGSGSIAAKSTVYKVINPTAETAPFVDRGGSTATDFPYRYPSSRHRGKGVNVVFCDGHTLFLSEKVDSWVYCQMLTPMKAGLSDRAKKWQRYDHDNAASAAVDYIFDEKDLEK